MGTLNFLVDGGDAFTAFTGATEKVAAGEDLDALVAYFGAHLDLTPPGSRVTGL